MTFLTSSGTVASSAQIVEIGRKPTNTAARDPSTTRRRIGDSSMSLALRSTATQRPRRERKLLYPDHRPSPDRPEANRAAVAVEPVVRRRHFATRPLHVGTAL